MSPTSSESGAASGGSPSAQAAVSASRRVAATSQRLREQREQRRFVRTFWMLVAALALVSAVFLLLGSLQGPKLSSAIVDPARVTEQSGQQLRLFANQPLGEVTADQVTVTPEAEVTVTVQNELLIVQFEQRLRSGTEYVVEVSDVAATSRDATATFTHRFTTARVSLLYLDRGESQDEVLRAPLDGTGRGEVVHAAAGIQHLASIESVIVVARDAPDGTSVLEVVSGDGSVQQLQLPEGVRVDRLIAPPVGTLLGVVLTSASTSDDLDAAGSLDRVLAVADLSGQGVVTIVPGLDGEPIRALNAGFLPDGATLIAHAFDQTLLRIDLVGEPFALPIGQVPEMYALSTDGSRLTGFDSFGGVVLDLATGVESRLDPSLIDGELAFGGEAILTRTELRVQKAAIADLAGGVRVVLIADDGTGAARVLLRTIDDRGSIGAFSISPNDQYVAVEVTPSVADAVPDGRPVNGRATSVTTIVIDLDSGAVVRTLEGFNVSW